MKRRVVPAQAKREVVFRYINRQGTWVIFDDGTEALESYLLTHVGS